jgi:hypothetical protein
LAGAIDGRWPAGDETNLGERARVRPNRRWAERYAGLRPVYREAAMSNQNVCHLLDSAMRSTLDRTGSFGVRGQPKPR